MDEPSLRFFGIDLIFFVDGTDARYGAARGWARFERAGSEVQRLQAEGLGNRIQRNCSVTQRMGDRACARYCQPGARARSIELPRDQSPRLLRTSELCAALSQCLA